MYTEAAGDGENAALAAGRLPVAATGKGTHASACPPRRRERWNGALQGGSREAMGIWQRRAETGGGRWRVNRMRVDAVDCQQLRADRALVAPSEHIPVRQVRGISGRHRDMYCALYYVDDSERSPHHNTVCPRISARLSETQRCRRAGPASLEAAIRSTTPGVPPLHPFIHSLRWVLPSSRLRLSPPTTPRNPAPGRLPLTPAVDPISRRRPA